MAEGNGVDAEAAKTSNENGKVDRRVARTHTAIIEAYKRLLMEKPFDQITVSAIAREARVDRKTFYAHFGSIDGLVDAIVDEEVVQIADTVEREYERSTKALDAEKGSEQWIETCMDIFFEELNNSIYNNISIHRKWLEGMSDETLIDLIRTPLERELLSRNLLLYDLPIDSIEWYLSYFLGGILTMYRKWATSDGSFPLEEVSSMARDLTMKGLSIFEEKQDELPAGGEGVAAADAGDEVDGRVAGADVGAGRAAAPEEVA